MAIAAKSGNGKGAETAPFGQAAEKYRSFGAAPIPCGGDDGKEPLVAWERIKFLPSRDVLGKWIARFPRANIGLLTGPSRLTVVDVDDPAMLDSMQRECGPTPVVVATPRGGRHLYYRSNGEATVTRLEGAPVDVRGIGGFIVCPPSCNPAGGAYGFLVGSPADLEHLPAARPGSLPSARQSSPSKAPERVEAGNRHNSLFRLLLRVAPECETIGELEFRALGWNEAACDPPLLEAEVRAVVRGVWKYREEGRLWIGGPARAVFLRGEVMALAPDSDAMMLLAVLRLEHGGRDHAFSISPKALAEHGVIPGWTDKRYRKARDFLLGLGALVRVYEGGNGTHDPHLYRLGKGAEMAPNIIENPPLFRGWRASTSPIADANPTAASSPFLSAPPLFGELPVLPTPTELLRQQAREWCEVQGRGAQTVLAQQLGLTRHQVCNFLRAAHRLNSPAESKLRDIVNGGGQP